MWGLGWRSLGSTMSGFDEAFGHQMIEDFIQGFSSNAVPTGEAELKPGIHELLHYLDEKKIPRVLALHKPAQSDRYSAGSRRLKGGISWDRLLWWCRHTGKPDPEIFEKALLAVPKEELVILEDWLVFMLLMGQGSHGSLRFDRADDHHWRKVLKVLPSLEMSQIF